MRLGSTYGSEFQQSNLTFFFQIFPFDLPENIRKPLVFWCFQGDQKETLGRKGLSGNCVVIYFHRIKCPNSHLELLPGNIFLAIKVSSVFSQILFENDGCFFVPKQVDLPWSRTWYDKKTYRFHSISLQYCISYRNQSFDLQSKSNDWFLYEMKHCAAMGYKNCSLKAKDSEMVSSPENLEHSLMESQEKIVKFWFSSFHPIEENNHICYWELVLWIVTQYFLLTISCHHYQACYATIMQYPFPLWQSL